MSNRVDKDLILVSLTNAEAQTMCRLHDLDAARGIDAGLDFAIEELIGPDNWNDWQQVAFKVCNALEGEDPIYWTLFTIQWTTLFSAVLYGRE